METFRKEQEAWEKKRKELLEKDRKYREDLEAELKRMKAALQQQQDELEREKLKL